jgi:hypothetical protein
MPRSECSAIWTVVDSIMLMQKPFVRMPNCLWFFFDTLGLFHDLYVLSHVDGDCWILVPLDEFIKVDALLFDRTAMLSENATSHSQGSSGIGRPTSLETGIPGLLSSAASPN